nr:hypothetical protein [Gemmatimonas groenlandica]
MHAVIDESRNIGDLWESSSLEQRSMILDYWVLDVLIVVRPVANMPRANHKAALVTLRTAPKAPYLLSLGEDLTEIESAAADSSARTSESASDNSAMWIAANAADVAIRPRAQAACPRTNGSSSESAEISDGTSCADPTLPSTTAALRFSPRSFARFIGDPLNAAEYSERESDSIHSAIDRASFPSSDLRDANASSVTGFENLPLYGHTSWEMCRQNRFRIDLSTGRITLGQQQLTCSDAS